MFIGNTVREPFAFMGDIRWIIALSLLLSVVLCLPAQIQELYRIAADDIGWITFKEWIAVGAIAAAIWAGAFQVATESRQKPDATSNSVIYVVGPALLGAFPILAMMVGQLLSLPSSVAGIEEIGSVFRVEDQALVGERRMLPLFAVCIAFALVAFFILTVRVGKKEHVFQLSRQMNATYFSRNRFFGLTIVGIVVLTTAFIYFPYWLAQFFGSFGVLALFTACVVGVLTHFALLTIKHSIPFLPLVFGPLLVVTALSGCDNHELRPAAEAKGDDTRISASTAFQNWLRQPSRVAEAARVGEFPVFIVTAQGGGIYAAHNAARFLARMQDLCPAFREHLFAISSVSGGSVGAATFAAALHADNTKPSLDVSAKQSCEKIAKFLGGTTKFEELDVPGPVEQRVASILSTDFLSPLVSGFLFSDFTQLFTPIAVPFFDRARFLEYTLEHAADRVLKSQKSTSERSNLLSSDFQSHWAPDNNMPALLLNTTDVGSGKRVVIAPFDINPQHPKDSGLCTLAKLERDAQDDKKVVSHSLHVPLSTAAFASARFPWVTPAATAKLKNDCITAHPRARLVDGGYAENSGIETAFDLIAELKKTEWGAADPKFRIYVFSLANSDYPDHGTFSFGEAMEPIRAMFSTQGSPTSIALKRAEEIDRLAVSDAAPAKPRMPIFGRADITGLFYSLPLGWTLSEKTGEIISESSGRYWDCVPDQKFNQSRDKHSNVIQSREKQRSAGGRQSNADCLQIRMFHLLNGDDARAFETFAKSEEAIGRYRNQLDAEKAASVKIPPRPLLVCYEEKLQERGRIAHQKRMDNYEEKLAKTPKDDPPAPIPPYRESHLSYFQADQVKTLLQEWDRLEEKDPHIIAYILGSVSYDSVDFTHTSENFWFSDVSQIPRPWLDRLNQTNAALIAAGQQPIDVTSLLRHPEQFANAVLGSKDNEFKNRPGTNDGWVYRLRGMYQLVGLEQYREATEKVKQLGQLPGLDLVNFPDALWDPRISAKVTFARLRTHKFANRTVFEMLKDDKLDWKAVRSLQRDMDRSATAAQAVDERSKMFLGCIEKALNPSEHKTWMSWFFGEDQD